MLNMGYIYKITNIVNKKAYIGQTKQDDVCKRWAEHKNSIKYNNGCPLLMGAFKKYGIDKFKFEVIIICFDEARFELEKYYIKKYDTFGKNGYNLNEGGEPGGFFKGHHHTKESIIKIKTKLSTNFKNEDFRKFHSQSIKDGLSKINLSTKIRTAMATKKAAGIPLFKNRINGNKGYEEVKEKIRTSINKLYANDLLNTNNIREKIRANAIKQRGRPVNQYTIEGVFVASYKYIKEAGDKTGIGRRSIQANLLEYSKSSGGFIWKYASKHVYTCHTIDAFFNV